jgi:hypothetical protein
MAGFSDLDFSPGLEIQHLTKEHFSSPISFQATASSRVFFVVAIFHYKKIVD